MRIQDGRLVALGVALLVVMGVLYTTWPDGDVTEQEAFDRGQQAGEEALAQPGWTEARQAEWIEACDDVACACLLDYVKPRYTPAEAVRLDWKAAPLRDVMLKCIKGN